MPVRVTTAKAVHVEPEQLVAALNSAVGSINAVFQMRDGLMAELAQIKEELGVASDVRLEQARIEALKREQEAFQYDFNLRKARLEQDLERLEEERREKLARAEEETKDRLRADAAEQTLKFKAEREEHDRRLKIEREDFERTKALFGEERAVFDERVKKMETEKSALREQLVAELNRDNEHQIKISALNHQREAEILKSQLKLEQANAGKFESLLNDSRLQNDKLAEQLSTLSREALASASSSAMAVKLKDIISQFHPESATGRGA